MNELHKEFVKYGAQARQALHRCKLLLPQIDRQKIWQKQGFSSIFEYAFKLAGMNRSQVEDALRIIRKIEDKPKLIEIAKNHGLNRIRPVVTIVTKETESFWSEKAAKMSNHALKAYVRAYRDEEKFRVDPENSVTRQIPNESTELRTDLIKKLQKLGDGDINKAIEDLFKLREESLEQTKPEPKKTTSRYIPTKIKRWVLNKYNHKCAFPNCTKPYDHLHHIQPFSLTHTHDPDQILPYCKAHHELTHHSHIDDEKLELIHKPKSNPRTYIDKLVIKHRMAASRT